MKFRIGPETVNWQIAQLTNEQRKLALIYLSGLSEDTFARAILAARGLPTPGDPVQYIKQEATAALTAENPPQTCQR